MNENLQAQINTYLGQLDGLTARGRQLRDALAKDASDRSVMAATRAWQEECGVTINQLSGGSKAHWLARAFSQAFLLRAAGGDAIEGAAPHEIVERLLEVLHQAAKTLSQSGEGPIVSATIEAPQPRRFEFVHNAELRPVLEQAYNDSRSAFEHGNYDEALRTSSGILEAIVTDALEHKSPSALTAAGAPYGKIAEWPFETRLKVAEEAGVIRGGCARLPGVARRYRDRGNGGAIVSERDARVTGQVLRVVMRDLDPGR